MKCCFLKVYDLRQSLCIHRNNVEMSKLFDVHDMSN